MAAATPDEVKKWKEYDYGHLKVIRELGIDQSKLPTDIKQRARGVILALGKINTDEGFRKLVTQSAAIGDDIITWHEREFKEEETPAVASSGTVAKTDADKGTGGSDNGGGAGDADKKGADGLTDAERRVLEQHGGGGNAGGGGGSGGSGGSQNQQQEEDGDVTFFGW